MLFGLALPSVITAAGFSRIQARGQAARGNGNTEGRTGLEEAQRKPAQSPDFSTTPKGKRRRGFPPSIKKPLRAIAAAANTKDKQAKDKRD